MWLGTLVIDAKKPRDIEKNICPFCDTNDKFDLSECERDHEYLYNSVAVLKVYTSMHKFMHEVIKV